MKKILTVFILACLSCVVYAQDNVIDEIVWVVGDDAILRSDIESQRLYLQNEGQRFDGDPYCVLPEQMAIQKLFLNQAKIDSVEVSENQVIQETDRWINFAINQMGSKEKLEEYFGKKISQLKDERKEMIMEQQTVEQMKRQLIGEIKLTPSEVRKYYSQLSKDSLPNIPTTVEVQIITMEPKIPFEDKVALRPASSLSRLKRQMPSRLVFASLPMISTAGNMNFRHWPVCIRKTRNQPKEAENLDFWVRQVCCPNSLTSLLT